MFSSTTQRTIYDWATYLIHVRDQGALGEYFDVRCEKKQNAGKSCAVIGSVICNLVTNCMEQSPSTDVHSCEFLGIPVLWDVMTMHHLASRSQRSEGRSRFHFQGFKVFEDEGHTFHRTLGTTPSDGQSHHKRPEPSS
jgi:hypothetical protein